MFLFVFNGVNYGGFLNDFVNLLLRWEVFCGDGFMLIVGGLCWLLVVEMVSVFGDERSWGYICLVGDCDCGKWNIWGFFLRDKGFVFGSFCWLYFSW